MSAPSMKDLMQMQELTRMTGLLNNVQLHQIKMWIHGILCANEAVIDFDPDTLVFVAEISNLDYGVLKQASGVDTFANFKARTEHFNQCMKVLLGDDYGVVIKMKDKILADFPPTSAPRKSNQDWKRIFKDEEKDNERNTR